MYTMYTQFEIIEVEIAPMPHTSTITIRLPLEVIHKLEDYAETLYMKPSSLGALVLQDKLEEWVQDYAQRVSTLMKERTRK